MRSPFTHRGRLGKLRWRVSVAEIARDGPFSSFPGVDRMLVLLSGHGVRLDRRGEQPVMCTPFEPLRSRRARVESRLLDGRRATSMWWGGAASGEMIVVSAAILRAPPTSATPRRILRLLRGRRHRGPEAHTLLCTRAAAASIRRRRCRRRPVAHEIPRAERAAPGAGRSASPSTSTTAGSSGRARPVSPPTSGDGRGTGRARHAERAFARVPARARGTHGAPSPDRSDTFWTWRDGDVRLPRSHRRRRVEAVAAQAYVEMAKAGYGAVAEFHYVHHDPAGKPYADPAELAWRIVAAAHRRASVSRCCRSSTRMRDSAERRRRAASGGSCTDVATFTRLSTRSRARRRHGYVLGIAPHSLRAVTPEELAQVVRLAAPTRRSTSTPPSRRARSTSATPWSRHASGRVAAVAGGGRRALVHRARDAHDRARDRWARRERRGRGPRADHRGRSRRRHVPRPRYSRAKRALRHRQRFEHHHSPFVELRQLEWSQRLRAAPAQRARRRRRRARRHSAVASARRAAARRRSGSRRAPSRPDGAPISSC